MKRSFFVDIGYACFAIISIDGIITDVPNIVKWMLGKNLTEIKAWLLSKKAKVYEYDD